MALFAPIVIIVILLSGGRKAEPRRPDAPRPPRVSARAEARVVLRPAAEKLLTREDVVRHAFDALKHDDFGHLQPVLPTVEDMKWLLAAVRKVDPDQAREMEESLQKRGGFSALLAEAVARGATTFRRIRDESAARLDWDAATLEGLQESQSTSEVQDGVEIAGLAFHVRVGGQTHVFGLPNCMRAGRGWLTSGTLRSEAEGDALAPTPKDVVAFVQMRNFEMAIQLYYLQNRRMPASLEMLTEPDPRTGEGYLERVPEDPWGRPYELRLLDARRFLIVSAGPDGASDTDDDLVWPEPGD